MIKEFAIKNDYKLTITKKIEKMNTTNNNKNVNLKGKLFINDNKKSENHPDYTGNITINNKDFYLSGWKTESKTGTKYINISIGKEIEEKKEETKQNDIFI